MTCFPQELQGQDSTFKGYKLMTTVSIPVYNKNNAAVRFFLHIHNIRR